MSPLSNSYVKANALERVEQFYPLHAYVCESCLLVQLQEFESPEKIFSDYAYFSSYSESWLQHCEAYTNYMIERFSFGRSHQVVEIASNDGYLLKYFKARGVPVLGIEPAENVARDAQAQGVETLVKFFGADTAAGLVRAGTRADLLLGNNVLGHVPDLNDFVRGLKILLEPKGVITMEFPHLLRLIGENQFDTIYHEHFSYFSFHTVERVFAHHGLALFDVEELPTHGGSIRIFAQHPETGRQAIHPRVAAMRDKETAFGINRMETYTGFAGQVCETKRALLDFLIGAKRAKKTVAGYGAPAKGNTLLNYCGIRTDFLDYTVDRSPHKQGAYLPGTRIPIFAPEKLAETRPDYVLILPWNLKDEIVGQMTFIRDWGGQFVVPIPRVEVLR
jgi:2-polyprenyl-3-methyl-5-hydroxy-6-metoxy-1,4-benzoquinol methylase